MKRIWAWKDQYEKRILGQLRDAALKISGLVHSYTGAADYELRIVTRDMHAFDEFLREKLLSLGLVSNIESRIVVRSVKKATTIPLGGSAAPQPART